MSAPGSPNAAAGRTVTLDVDILGRSYKVACKDGERDELTQAVAHLDRRMREIRDQGKVSGADRIAVMAALNITHELLRVRSGGGDGDARARTPARVDAAALPGAAAIDGPAAQRRIRDMGAAIDTLLAGQEKLF
jgi:cell division protein ZapA